MEYFPSNKDRAYFKIAECMSKLSDHRYKIGCVVINHHKIISSGYNSNFKIHKFQKMLDEKFFNDGKSKGCKHAEIDALLPLIKDKVDLTKAIIYTFRRDDDGNLGLARPCSRCMSVIKSLGIKKLKYTTNCGYASEVII